MYGKRATTAIAAAALAIAAAALPAAASAQQGAGEFELRLSSQTPASPTGLFLRVLYQAPGEPEGKAPALETIAIHLPTGTRFDTGAVPVCEATDSDIRLRGPGACPSQSRVGAGGLVATTGLPLDPLHADVTVFNGGDELISVVTVPGTGISPGLDRLKIEGDRLTPHPPATPGGPPDGRTTIREIRFEIPQRTAVLDGRPRSFLTTPPACAAGLWQSTLNVRYVGFPEPYELRSATRCQVPARPRAAAPMSVTVNPSAVRSGRRVRLRVRVRSRSAVCRRGVRIRVGRRSVRTSSSGRAVVRMRFVKRGRRAVRASRPGCRPAVAWIRVR